MYTLTNYWIPILPVIGALMCSLGYAVYVDNPRSWTNRFFGLLTCSIGFWMFLWVINQIYASKYVGMEAEPYTFIIFLYETQFYLIAFIGPLFLLTVLEISGLINSENRLKVSALIMIFPLINITLLTYSIIAGHEWMHLYGTISDGHFSISQGPLFQYFHVPYNYVMILGSWLILLHKAIKPRYALEKRQAVTLIFGSLFALIGNIITITGTNPLTGMYYVDPTFLGFGGTVVVYGYAIWKHRLIRIAPEVEGVKKGETGYDLEGGRVYLATDVEKAFTIFADLVHHGTPGLAFSSKVKEDIRSRYDIQKTPLIKLSEEVGRDTLNPALEEHSEMIPFLISDFMGEAERCIVLIHDLDRWMDETITEIPVIIDLMDDIKEEISKDGIVILVVSDNIKEQLMGYFKSDIINTL